MSRSRIFLLGLTFIVVGMGCSKDSLDPECQRLKDRMTVNDTESVKAIITTYINMLPSKNYDQQNLEVLSASISNNCGISAVVLCFDCIDTLPEQSEIKVSFIFFGNTIQRIIDISYSANNEMKVVNMHE